MSVSSLSRATKLRYGGFYLPAAAFGYASVFAEEYVSIPFIGIGLEIYASLTVFSILVATIEHDLFRSTFGPTNTEPRPKDKSTVIKRLFYVLINEGRPSYYGDLGSLSRKIDPSLKRVIIVAIAGICTISLILLIPYSMWVLFQMTSPNNLFPAGLLFVQSVWVARFLLPSWWPNIYLTDFRTAPSVSNDVEEFAKVLVSSDILGEFEYEYRAENGGELLLKYESMAVNGEEERAVFAHIVTAFSGTVAKGEYPCRRLRATVMESGEPVAEYTINSGEARAYADGELQFEELLYSVIDGII